MPDPFLDALKQVTSIDAGTGVSDAGDVRFNIQGRGSMVLNHGAQELTIPAELGRDADGKRGWHLFPEDTDADAQTRAEAVRVIRMALEDAGYLVWIGDAG